MNVLLTMLLALLVCPSNLPTCRSDHRFTISPPEGYEPIPLVLPTGVQGQGGREVGVRIRDGRIGR